MFLKLVVLACVLLGSLEQEFPQDKSVFETVLVSSENGGVIVHGAKYVRVFDPKVGKYAYKKVTVDNGKIHREAGYLDDATSPSILGPIPSPPMNSTSLMDFIGSFMKDMFSHFILLQ